jgi:hypothetical protein
MSVVCSQQSGAPSGSAPAGPRSSCVPCSSVCTRSLARSRSPLARSPRNALAIYLSWPPRATCCLVVKLIIIIIVTCEMHPSPRNCTRSQDATTCRRVKVSAGQARHHENPVRSPSACVVIVLLLHRGTQRCIASRAKRSAPLQQGPVGTAPCRALPPPPSSSDVVIVGLDLRGDLPVELLCVSEDGVRLAQQHREHPRRVLFAQRRAAHVLHVRVLHGRHQ